MSTFKTDVFQSTKILLTIVKVFEYILIVLPEVSVLVTILLVPVTCKYATCSEVGVSLISSAGR
jgi:hypothetical protein